MKHARLFQKKDIKYYFSSIVNEFVRKLAVGKLFYSASGTYAAYELTLLPTFIQLRLE